MTFVGGKAVEQHTEGQKPAEGSAHATERDAAIAAVKTALEEHGKQAAKEAKAARAKDPLAPKERAEDGKFLPKDASLSPEDKADAERAAAVKKLEKTSGTGVEEPKAEEEDPDAVALRKALDGRKRAAKAKAEAQQTLERERHEARQVHQQYTAELAKVQREKEKYERWAKDPVRFISESGRAPEDLIMELAQAGTPEAKRRAAIEAEKDEIRQLRAWQEREENNRKAFAEHQAKQQKVQFRQSVEKQLLANAYQVSPETQEEKYPHLATMYKGHEDQLCSDADRVADQYRAATVGQGPQGRGLEATFEEICEYLEERNAKWYRSMYGRASRLNGSQAATGSMGQPAQVNSQARGNQVRPSSVAGRGISPNDSSERRTLGTLRDLDGEERREAAMIAVRAAITASGGHS